MKPRPRYIVTFDPRVDGWSYAAWTKAKVQTIYEGDDETVMYSHVSAVENVLIATYGTGEIEINENGEPRSIEYRHGERIDLRSTLSARAKKFAKKP